MYLNVVLRCTEENYKYDGKYLRNLNLDVRIHQTRILNTLSRNEPANILRLQHNDYPYETTSYAVTGTFN